MRRKIESTRIPEDDKTPPSGEKRLIRDLEYHPEWEKKDYPRGIQQKEKSRRRKPPGKDLLEQMDSYNELVAAGVSFKDSFWEHLQKNYGEKVLSLQGLRADERREKMIAELSRRGSSAGDLEKRSDVELLEAFLKEI